MVRVYEIIFYFAYVWQTKIMKEKDIPFFATLITFSGIFVFYYLMVHLILIQYGVLNKTSNLNKIIGYSFVTFVLLLNYIYFNNKYKGIISKYDKLLKNNINKLMYCFVILILIPIVYIYYYIFK